MAPLHMSIKGAAKYAEIGESTMREYVHSMTPPPYLKVGKKYMIQVAALPEYLEERQEVRNGR